MRYYVGHKGKFGHEFLEFEFRPDGKVRFDVSAPLLHVCKSLCVTVAGAAVATD